MIEQIKHSVNSTPGFGLSCKVLIFKIIENVLYIAREGGAGFAHSGLLARAATVVHPKFLPNVPCSDEQSDRLEKSLKNC